MSLQSVEQLSLGFLAYLPITDDAWADSDMEYVAKTDGFRAPFLGRLPHFGSPGDYECREKLGSADVLRRFCRSRIEFCMMAAIPVKPSLSVSRGKQKP